MYAAYEALSDRMKAYLAGLTAIHDGEHVYRGMFANDGVADKARYPRAEHPVIRTHPVTGRKALYVNKGFTTRILGIDEELVNVQGSGCSLGHPIAMSGARMVISLVHELRRRGGGTGVAAMCAGGGMSSAVVLDVPGA